jgi:adenine-specific DNA methylase
VWLARKAGRYVALRLLANAEKKRVDVEIVEPGSARIEVEGTVRKGSATCPCCGYTTPVGSVRRQLRERKGGTSDARLLAVVCTLETENGEETGRYYRLAVEADLEGPRVAGEELERRVREDTGALSLVPEEGISPNELRRISVPIYGMTTWGDLFTPRQALTLSTLVSLVREAPAEEAVRTCLALAVSRQADYSSSVCSWHASGEKMRNTFGRQAVPMVWDFTEVAPFAGSTGDFSGALEWVTKVCEANVLGERAAQVTQASAARHPLHDDQAQAVVTDPPYYDAVAYAYLSDFFYVWLRRCLAETHPDLFGGPATPKEEEIVVDRPHELSRSNHDVAYYERELCKAFGEARRVVRPDGLGVVVFASKTTASWEAILQALVKAGWILTASWPIDTEMESRLAAMGQARLASSVHLVCRPREEPSGTLGEDVGDWRDVLGELPGRIRAWLPRLRDEGVVGADAIFACLGPALEVFSRYGRVEKASGEEVELREYRACVGGRLARGAEHGV